MIKNHRINSLSCVITNFSSPDFSNTKDEEFYTNIISLYKMSEENVKGGLADFYKIQREKADDIKRNLQFHYSEFITRILMDISSVLVPTINFINSNNYKSFITKDEKAVEINSYEDIKRIKNNKNYKFLGMLKLIYDGKLEIDGINKKAINIFFSATKRIG